jgi:hypothetical protein
MDRAQSIARDLSFSFVIKDMEAAAKPFHLVRQRGRSVDRVVASYFRPYDKLSGPDHLSGGPEVWSKGLGQERNGAGSGLVARFSESGRSKNDA